MEQRARLAPVAFDGSIRTSQDLGGLFDRKAGEIPQLDDPAEPIVQARQAFERFVERDDVSRAFQGGNNASPSNDVKTAPPPRLPAACFRA